MPAQDLSLDMLELTEIPAYEAFHKQTLELYCKLCGYGNSKVAHYLCAHVDQEQLMYAIKNPFMSGPLRAGFSDMLIAVHLQLHKEYRKMTNNEFVVPLVSDLSTKNVFESEDVFPALTYPTFSIRPIMEAEDVHQRFRQISKFLNHLNDSQSINSNFSPYTIPREQELKLQPPAFNFEALKNYVMEGLTDCTIRAVLNCRDLIGGDTFYHFELAQISITAIDRL